WREEPLYLAKVVSFMNLSGPPVARLLRLLGTTPEQLVVVYDDLDLPFGTVRTRQRGRHGGHHGLEAILTTLATHEVRRVKIGVGRPATRDEVVDWVLRRFRTRSGRPCPGCSSAPPTRPSSSPSAYGHEGSRRGVRAWTPPGPRAINYPFTQAT